ncbi:hypothetical protein F2Q69_00057569 [Brassica cretica]|uniref:Auxin-responsive protein n=1 Tax=Brassica cretica TaxID=69181 RepID=A0A8S9MLF1_BRACR|nr:hypothetical protein F2Q69_00057569 [Brassica cretica]
MSPFRTRCGGLAHARAKSYQSPQPLPSSWSWFTPMLPLVFVFVRLEKKESDTLKLRWQVVGWPPIRSYRMNSMVNQSKTLAMEDPIKNRTDGTTKMRMFVKVTMDGIPIGRKIDLNAHRCYESLSNTLEEMFLKPKTDGNLETRLKILPDGSSGFVLTYEDKEGDWMLVGDVPWGMFIGSVKRLRIMKTSEATGTVIASQQLFLCLDACAAAICVPWDDRITLIV